MSPDSIVSFCECFAWSQRNGLPATGVVIVFIPSICGLLAFCQLKFNTAAVVAVVKAQVVGNFLL